MKRASNASSVTPVTTPVTSTPITSQQWGPQRPDASKQLFPRAASALVRIRTLPGMDPFMAIAMRDSGELPTYLRDSLDVTPPGMALDPVSLLRRLLRLGAPLSLLFNAVPDVAKKLDVLGVEQALDERNVKRALYKFCEACVQELGFKWDTDLFTIKEVLTGPTGELLRPLNTLELLLARLDPPTVLGEGFSTPPESPQDQRSKYVNELLQTERRYVQDLELMMEYQDEMLAQQIPRETVQRIFPSLPRLLDFQRRLLIGIEYQAHLAPESQNFGWLFLHLESDFDVYAHFTVHQQEATETAVAETPALMPLSHIIEPLYGLPTMLLKPVQRIMRYPMLIKEISKHTPRDWPHASELPQAFEMIQAIVNEVNEMKRRAENVFVSRDLQGRLKDWRGLDIAAMGELLLNGAFPVASLGEQEQEFNLYLFEKVLLCCRDRVNARKTPLTKMRATRQSQGKSLSLELKGRIYTSYITTATTAKQPTGYVLSLGWGHKNDASETGMFDIRLANEEQAQKWENTIRKLMVSRRDHDSSMRSSSASARSSTQSTTLGRWISNGGGFIDDDSSATRGVQFYDDSPSAATSPMGALRKLSVSSTSSQHTQGSNSGTSGGSRSSLTLANSSATHRQSRTHLKGTDSSASLAPPGQRKVRIHSQGDTFLIVVPPDIGYEQLMNRVERKLKLCGKIPTSGSTVPLAFKYKDEDDDLVELETNEDLAVAIEAVPDRQELTIYVN